MDSEEDQCLFCHNDIEDVLIDYSHKCGNYKIHQKCFDKWFVKNLDSCIICRESILDDNNYENVSNTRLIIPLVQNNNKVKWYQKYIYIYISLYWGVIIGFLVIYKINN